MSYRGHGSGNKLQRQKKDCWSLEKRERQGKCTWEKGVGKELMFSIERAELGPLSQGLLRVWILGGVSAEDLSGIHQLSRCVLSGLWSSFIGGNQGRGH